MILSDIDIKKLIEKGDIKVDPMPDLEKALGTVSLDLRLGHDFLTYKRTSSPFIDVRDPESFKHLTEDVIKKTDEAFVLHPHEFVLASTFERLELPDTLAGRLEGKSSLGRLGVVVHSTAGKVDPGWKGRLVLEIANIGTIPIALYPEMRICQILFEQISAKTVGFTERSGEVYKNQNKTTGSGGNWN